MTEEPDLKDISMMWADLPPISDSPPAVNRWSMGHAKISNVFFLNLVRI